MVYFPGVPENRRDTLITAIDTITIDRYFYNDADGLSGNRLYTLTIFSYPTGALPKDSVSLRDALLTESVLATAESVSGAVVFSEPLPDGLWPGQLFRIDYADNQASVHSRAYFVEDRYFQLQVYALKTDGGVKSRERFFDNFAPATEPEFGGK